MSATIERRVSPTATRKKEVIVDFDARELKAPFSLRCGALLIDYIIVVSLPILSLLAGRFLGEDGRKLLNSELSNAGWLAAVLLGITNLVIFPMISGQSIGKMLTGLRIVKTDGSAPGLISLLVRHTIGYLLIILTLGLGFIISILNSKGRALDDYLSGTVVIYGKRRPKSLNNEQ